MRNKAETIRLRPNVRFRLTLSKEFNIDKGRLLNGERYEKALKIFDLVEQRRDLMLKNLLLFDGILFLVLAGKTIKIPGLDLQISDLPAALEITTILSSFSFLMLLLNFSTYLAYAAILDEFSNRKVAGSGVDPDLITATDRPLDLWLKLFRPKMNLYGIDFYKSRTPFNIFSLLGTLLVMMTILSFIVLHGCLLYSSVAQTFSSGLVWWHYGYLGFVGLAHLAALIILILENYPFKFDIPETIDPQTTSVRRGEISVLYGGETVQLHGGRHGAK